MVREYWQCRRCRKVYWEGPKFESTSDKFSGLVPGSQTTLDMLYSLLPDGASGVAGTRGDTAADVSPVEQAM